MQSWADCITGTHESSFWKLKPGDAYILRSGGGGGYGTPLERDLDLLARDMRGGYVSRDYAENVYGAVIAPDGTIDRAATQARRADMQKQGLPFDQPISETLLSPPPPADPKQTAAPEKLTEEERVAWAMTCRCCS